MRFKTETAHKRIIKLANRLLDELEHAGYSHQSHECHHVDVWVIGTDEIQVQNILNDWTVVGKRMGGCADGD